MELVPPRPLHANIFLPLCMKSHYAGLNKISYLP